MRRSNKRASRTGVSEPSLRLAQRFLHDSLDYAIIVVDLQGRIMGWLGASEHVFGYTASEVVGAPLDTIFVPEDRERGRPQHELAAASAGAAAADDRWHLRKDGARVWVSGSVLAVHDEQGRPEGFVKVVRDRTDMRMQIERLGNQAQRLKQENEALHKLIAMLGHEMRTPLAAGMNAAAVLEAVVQDDQGQRVLQMLRRQQQVLRRLADDLLDATRADLGRPALKLGKVELREVVEDTVGTLLPQFERKGVQLIDLTPPVPLWLRADRERLQQILSNLLDNALKYTPEGGSAWVNATVEETSALIRVQDTGIGIPAEILPRIFELFTQEPRAAATAPGGLGLGLTLVKDYVQWHGGMLEARSAGRDKGSEFTVRLPLDGPPGGLPSDPSG